MIKAIRSIFPLLLLPLIVVAILALPSCQQDELCEELTNNPLRVGLYRIIENDTLLSPVLILKVYGVGMNDTIEENLIYNQEPGAQIMELPLNPSQDSTGFVIVFPRATDTLWVTYQRTTHLVSVDCGFVEHYSLLTTSVTENYILGLETLNPQIINTADEHLQILLPAPDELVPGL